MTRHFFHNIVELTQLASETLPEGRYYTTPTGARYPSVTTVIGRATDHTDLERWRSAVGAEEAERVSRFARIRGGRLHSLCEAHLSNRDPPHVPNFIERASFLTVAEVLDERVGTVYGIECPLYSDRLRTAGRADAVAEFDGEATVIDFKTSRNLKHDAEIQHYFLQACTYAVMFTELTGSTVPQVAVVIAVDHDAARVYKQRVDRWVPAIDKVFTGILTPI